MPRTFSLRTLFAAMLLLSFVFARFGEGLWLEFRETHHVRRLQEMGAYVNFHDTAPDESNWWDKNFHDTAPDESNWWDKISSLPIWLRRICGVSEHASSITCDKLTINDADLAHIGGLPYLSCLNIWNCPNIDGPGLGHLRDSNVKVILLVGSNVSDDWLRSVSSIRSNRVLTLDDASITDVGLRHLERSKLKMITIRGIQNANITQVGVENLQRALPDCELVIELNRIHYQTEPEMFMQPIHLN